MLEAGRNIGERYKIISHLGTGGMATVYLARDLILEREVAVKVLRQDFYTNPDAMRRFRREALSATQLTHPNIVGVYDVGEENGSSYIVMEYVKGQDLKSYIDERGPISPRESVAIMKQILSAIEMAHRNRIIHRDIKPQNILIDQYGNVKITDFGIAIALSETSLTQTNTLLGSVHYLSPEQARGGMATIKSDIYALGVVLFELLAGHVPFDGESAVSIALKHFQSPMPQLTKIMPTIPQSLENVVLKATAKDPLNRYDSCEEMLDDITTALNPNRIHESVYQPNTFTGETKVLKPVVEHSPIKKTATSFEDIPIVPLDNEPPMPVENANKQLEKKKRRKWPWVVLGLMVVASVFLFFYYSLVMNAPKDVEIPNVVNLTEEDATKLLEKFDLSVKDIKRESSETVEAGKVLDSNPKPGTSVKTGSAVNLIVSTGTQKITVANYEGQDYEQARDELKKLGFIVERREDYDDDTPEGKIISQSIEAGKELIAKDQVMTLTISKGQSPIVIKDLSKYSRQAIEDYAKQNGLLVSFSEKESDSMPQGAVISQNPAAGTEVKQGDTLTIVLSKGLGERTVTKKITIPYAKPAESSQESEANSSVVAKSNVVEIYVEDANFSFDSIYQTYKITESKTIDIKFTLSNKVPKGRYKIVRDGETIEEGYAQ